MDLLGFEPLLGAGIGRLIRGLTEGDPVAWGVVGVIVVVAIVGGIWKARSAPK